MPVPPSPPGKPAGLPSVSCRSGTLTTLYGGRDRRGPSRTCRAPLPEAETGDAAEVTVTRPPLPRPSRPGYRSRRLSLFPWRRCLLPVDHLPRRAAPRHRLPPRAAPRRHLPLRAAPRHRPPPLAGAPALIRDPNRDLYPWAPAAGTARSAGSDPLPRPRRPPPSSVLPAGHPAIAATGPLPRLDRPRGGTPRRSRRADASRSPAGTGTEPSRHCPATRSKTRSFAAILKRHTGVPAGVRPSAGSAVRLPTRVRKLSNITASVPVGVCSRYRRGGPGLRPRCPASNCSGGPAGQLCIDAGCVHHLLMPAGGSGRSAL